MIGIFSFYVSCDTSFTVRDMVVYFVGAGDCTPLSGIVDKWPKNIIEANFQDGITDTGEDYFGDHLLLERVKLSTTTKILRSCSFFGCIKLRDISFPPSLQHIDGKCFSRCSSIQYLNYTGKNLIIDVNSFFDCSDLQSICIIASSVFIEHATFYSPSLKSITISSKNTTIMESAFGHHSSLKYVNISGFRTVNSSTNAPNITIFYSYSVEELHLEAETMNIVSSMLDPYKNLSICSLTAKSLKVDSFSNSGLTELKLHSSESTFSTTNTMFSKCVNLQNITLQGNIILISENTFKSCTSLRNIIIDSNADTITFSQNSFAESNSIQTIEINAQEIVAESNAFFKLNNLDYMTISCESINMKQGIVIGLCALKWIEIRGRILFGKNTPFEANENLENVSLISSLSDSITFENCLHLQRTKNLYVEAGNITFAEFHGIEDLTSLKLKCKTVYFVYPLYPSSIEYIEIEGVVDTCEKAFQNLKMLKSFILRNNNLSTKMANIKPMTFVNLSHFKLAVLDSNHMQIYQKGFLNCSALEEVRGRGSKSADGFYQCYSLSKIKFVEGMFLSLFFYDYNSCPNIRTIILEATDVAFIGLTSVIENRIEELMVSGERIHIENILSNSTHLKRVYLNYSHIFLDRTLYNCTNLRYLNINGTEYNDTLDYSTLDVKFYFYLKRTGFSKVLNVRNESINDAFSYYPNLEFVSFSSKVVEMKNCFAGSPKLHTIFFKAFQTEPRKGVFEIPFSVKNAYNVIHGSSIRQLIIDECQDYSRLIQDCDTLETIHIKSITHPVENLVDGNLNLKLILLPYTINQMVLHMANVASPLVEVYYCGVDNDYTKAPDFFPFVPKTVYVTRFYKLNLFATKYVTTISVDACFKMIEKSEYVDTYCKIGERSLVMDILPIFLFMLISS